MTILDLSRVEKNRLLFSMLTALKIPDQISEQRDAIFESLAFSFCHMDPRDYLESRLLALTIAEHLAEIGVEKYSIKVSDVEEGAICTTTCAKTALRHLGLFKNPMHSGVYTNCGTGSAEIVLPAHIWDGWRSVDW
jgi:hypothetical protein